MRINSERDLLNAEVRKSIIKEINSTENKARKEKAYKFYQCYKDNTKEYVLRQLRLQFESDTVLEMSYALTNLGFARKVVDKLARVYNYGVEREVMVDDKVDEEATRAIAEITKECDVNRIFKKTNRWLKRDKNCVQFIAPRKVTFTEGEEKYTIKPTVLPAFLYDVVELKDNREIAGCYILSDFCPSKNSKMYYTQGDASVRIRQPDADGNYPFTDGHDGIIADNVKDQETYGGNYVFWSDSYHFTCNEKGELLDEDGKITTQVGDNPIAMMPFVNYAEDQDNSFWAQGGDDLIDAAITINAMITNIIHIAITQGYGQAVVSGAKPPRAIKMGPNKVIILEQSNTDEPKPEFKFETAQPPLDQLRQLVEFFVALTLTTNNLSTSGVSTALNGGATFPSGIAMLIDKAESMEDIEDQRQIFIDKEPLFWTIFSKWHEVLLASKELDDCLAEITMPKEDFDINLKYGKPTPIVSETEKLDVLKKKKELGLVSMLDMMRSEYPDLTDEQLAAKIKEIAQEALKAMVDAQNAMGAQKLDADGNPLPPDENMPPAEGAKPGEKPPGNAATPTAKPKGPAFPPKATDKKADVKTDGNKVD